jgi:adenosine deaminase
MFSDPQQHRSMGVPLSFALCPYGNEIVRPGYKQAPIRQMLDTGFCPTLNADDSVYVGDDHLLENLIIALPDTAPSEEDVLRLTCSSFEAAWIDDEERQLYLTALGFLASSRGRQ